MQLYIGEIQDKTAVLLEEESRHFSKVTRGKIGQTILVTDGKGKIGQGKVTEIHNKYTVVEIEEWLENQEKRNFHLHVAIAPTKNMDRLEFFLEKATEMGIDEITLLKTFHSERKNIKWERCEKIIHAACKQSLKANFPILHDLTPFHEFIQKEQQATALIAHCHPDFERVHFKKIEQKNTDYLILIGPEGDFSKEEIEMATQKGFKGVSLGNQRLRTETAALNAVFAVNWFNQP